MPPITSQTVVFNEEIWKKYLDGLLTNHPAAGKVDWSKPTTTPAEGLNKLVEDGPCGAAQGPWPTEGLPVEDYLTDQNSWWANPGIDFDTEDGEEPFTEVSLKHEEYRTYIYGNGVEFTISEPVWLITDHSAPEKHFVEDATAVYEVRPGWLAIKKGY